MLFEVSIDEFLFVDFCGDDCDKAIIGEMRPALFKDLLLLIRSAERLRAVGPLLLSIADVVAIFAEILGPFDDGKSGGEVSVFVVV